jgi:thiol-disulfide isomerase/thioredoxin
MKKLTTHIVFILSLWNFGVNAQHTITGNFPPLVSQQVRLIGFNDFGIYTIDSAVVSQQGIFNVNYTDKDYGMGYLTTTDNKAYFVVLANEDIVLEGETLSNPESIITISGKENKLFVQYTIDHSSREQVLSAWDFLQKRYQTDSLFIKHKQTQQGIDTEMLRIKQEDAAFLKNLDPKSYISWFLPISNLISSVSNVAQYQTDKIPSTLTSFRKIDYSDQRLYKSGLLKDVLESHFWLLENMNRPLDSAFTEMFISIDSILIDLSKNEKKFNQVTKYIFNLLERQSLFEASEYLAVKVLTQNSCTVHDDLANQLESYRTMKIGNTAPNIAFSGDILKNGTVLKTQASLSDINSAYKIVIFGASWCYKCVEELSQLLPLYQKWQSKGVEVIFVSLDTEESVFKEFSSIFPFISICDYKKWDTQAVKDYYVFASPTLFLLDKDQKILLRPNSINQIDTWVDYYLK